MDSATIAIIVSVVLGAPSIYFGFKAVRASTLADQRMVATAQADAVKAADEKARTEERQRCADRETAFLRDLEEVTKDRDRHAANEAALQLQINMLRAGKDGGV